MRLIYLATVFLLVPSLIALGVVKTGWAKEREDAYNLARGKSYTISAEWPDPLFAKSELVDYPDVGNKELTDGKKGSASYTDPAWHILNRQGMRTIVVDLERASSISAVRVRFLQYKAAGVRVPRYVDFAFSNDLDAWEPGGTSETNLGTWSDEQRVEEFSLESLDYYCRYVQLKFPADVFVMIDEIEVIGNQAAVEGARMPQGVAEAQEEAKGFAPAGSTQAGGARHIVLATYAYPPKPVDGEWKTEDYLPYVAYVDKQGVVKDWMFDTILLAPQGTTPSEHSLGTAKPAPADMADWQWYLEETFRSGYQLDALDQATELAQNSMQDSDKKVKVILALPPPHSKQRRFGDLNGDGQPESFSFHDVGPEAALANRLAAEDWLISEFLRRWEESGYQNLELIGFYWISESIRFADSPNEEDLVRGVAANVHERGYRFFWIPYYGSEGSYDWQRYGFDVAMLQPNYMFTATDTERVHLAAKQAEALGMGFEMEKHWLDSPTEQLKWLDYLAAGVADGYINSIVGYYQNYKDFGRAAKAYSFDRRLFYEYVYQFIKGTYSP